MEKLIKRSELLPDFSKPNKLEEAKHLINKFGTNMHEHAYIVGKLLNWVQIKFNSKNIFEAWIDENIWFGIRTARHFMAHTKRCDKAGKILEYHQRKQLSSGAIIAPLSG